MPVSMNIRPATFQSYSVGMQGRKAETSSETSLEIVIEKCKFSFFNEKKFPFHFILPAFQKGFHLSSSLISTIFGWY